MANEGLTVKIRSIKRAAAITISYLLLALPAMAQPQPSGFPAPPDLDCRKIGLVPHCYAQGVLTNAPPWSSEKEAESNIVLRPMAFYSSSCKGTTSKPKIGGYTNCYCKMEPAKLVPQLPPWDMDLVDKKDLPKYYRCE
jgi:hypothetical protein